MQQLTQWGVCLLSLLWMVYLPGLGLLRVAQRVRPNRSEAWYLAWLLGCVATGPILYIAGTLQFSPLVAILACTAVGAILLAISRVLPRRITFPKAPALPRLALPVVVLVSLTLASPYLEVVTARDVYPNTVTDWNGRQAVIWSLQQFGLPLQDVLFYPGRSVPMYYPAGPYLAVAAAAQAGGPGVPQALPYALFVAMTFASLCMLVGNMSARFFNSPRAGMWAIVLLSIGGMDVAINLVLMAKGRQISLGHVSAWAAQLRIVGVYVAALWACPHVAAAGAALVALRWLPMNLVRRPGAVLATGIVMAGVFYFSAYVAVALVVILALALVRRAADRRWRRWLRHATGLFVALVLAAALALPQVLDLSRADHGAKPKLIVSTPQASIHPLSPIVGESIGRWADLGAQLVLQLLPLGLIGLAAWLCLRPGRRWRFQGSLLGWCIPLSIAMVLIVRSTGMFNDWGARAILPLQLGCAVLGGGLMARAFTWRRSLRWGAYALILSGMSATVWEIGTQHMGRYLAQKPEHRFSLFEACQAIRQRTPPQSILMIDLTIDGINYARRWSDRRSLLADTVHGSMAYVDPVALDDIKQACQAIPREGIKPSNIRRLRRLGVTHALLEGRSEVPSFADAVIFRNRDFLVLDLSRIGD